MATQQEIDHLSAGIGLPRGGKFMEALDTYGTEYFGSEYAERCVPHSIEITFDGDYGRVNWSCTLFAPASVIAEALADSGTE